MSFILCLVDGLLCFGRLIMESLYCDVFVGNVCNLVVCCVQNDAYVCSCRLFEDPFQR
jgi:hypothetical protein